MPKYGVNYHVEKSQPGGLVRKIDYPDSIRDEKAADERNSTFQTAKKC